MPRYLCSSYKEYGTCNSYSITEPKLLSHVIATLEAKFLDPKQLAELYKVAKQTEAEMAVDNKKVNHQSAIAKINASIAHAEGNLAIIPKNRVQGILDKITGWEIEKAKLEELILQAGASPLEEYHQMVKFMKEFLWEWREAMQEGDMSSVYFLMRQAIARVELRFETEVVKVRQRHTLVEGVVYFNGGSPAKFVDHTTIKPRKAGVSDNAQSSMTPSTIASRTCPAPSAAPVPTPSRTSHYPTPCNWRTRD